MKKPITAAILLFSAILLFFVTSGVFAQGYGKSYPGNSPYNNSRYDHGRYDTRLPASNRQEALLINDLQREARGRIADGIARGTLTTQEAIRLLNEYERISAKERRSLANGRLTNRETREITRDLDNLIRGIRYEKMDTQHERNRMAQRRY